MNDKKIRFGLSIHFSSDGRLLCANEYPEQMRVLDAATGKQIWSSHSYGDTFSSDGKTLVVSNHLSDSLTLIDTDSLKVRRHIDLGGPKPDNARRGEILFHSAKFTVQQQFTCASCHPDGGSDGLNWDLPRDGVGNFLNTRSLLGVKDTAPYG